MSRVRRNHCGRILPAPGTRETIEIEKQGKLLSVKRKAGVKLPAHESVRGEITVFSARSRKRLLSFINTLAWGKIPHSLFITLTYPDEATWDDKDERRKHLYLFMRYMEEHLGRQVCGLWRVEWIDRKSGPCEGMIAPHFHLILFGVRYIHWGYIRLWWRKSIRSVRGTRVKVVGCKNVARACFYISKYVAKVASGFNLDIGPYCNKGGAHHGKIRKNLIPRETMVVLDNVTNEEIEWLCSRANTILKWRQPNDDNGFVLMGDMANYLYSEFLHFRLANQIE